mmetsp:Transcript_57008/g.166927  ORF Transcript_57008/g.166927 Transcript_57008/m.166927 type:complete len:98 (+) Transcript_57008:342-635(+)
MWTSEVPTYDATKLITPYTTVKEMMMRSVRRYCIVVEEDVKITQVEEEATAMEGSTPMMRKKGEKMSPPPIPTSPARQPVQTAMRLYLRVSDSLQPS